MTILARLLAVGACMPLLLGGQPTSAATPSPTPTPMLGPAVTPPAPQSASFNIIPWVNGQNSAHEVTAFIGETLCATGVPVVPPASPPVGASRIIFGITVPSDEALPGCGYEGAVVTFFVDSQKADRTAIWHSGIAGPAGLMNIMIGSPFARFNVIPAPANPFGQDRRLVSFIGDKPCGGSDGVVYSSEQEPGCGVEGSQVTFKLLDAQGNVIAVANEKATWHAWDGIAEPQQINLTFGPAGGMSMPGTGTGNGPARAAAASWGPLALALASLGLTGGIAALAFRRRAAGR